MTLLAHIQSKLGKPYQDLEFLLRSLQEALEASNFSDLTKAVPWVGEDSHPDPAHFQNRHVQMYSLVFHLLNMVEENSAVQTRRHMESESLTSINGLWAKNLFTLREQGISASEVAAVLPEIHVEPVFTAHPTEAKRPIVLEHHRELYLLLVKRENQMYTEMEQRETAREIRLLLERLLRTGELYVEKPDVTFERETILHYLVNALPAALPIVDRRLQQAWEHLGFDPELIQKAGQLPRITFGNWVGGDRDGHPFVTAEVTQQTLQILRLNAMVVIRRGLRKLTKNLSFVYPLIESSEALQERIARLESSLEQAGVMHRHYPGEAFRYFTELMTAGLPVDVERDHATQLNEHAASYRQSSELIHDLELLQEALIEYGASTLAYSDVNDVIRIVQTFGFHLADLDIRQNSRVHELALSQLMTAAGLDGEAYLAGDEEERLAFLNQELLSARPFTHPNMPLPPEAEKVVSVYRVLAQHIESYGSSRAIGGLIVSMTRSQSDLLAVYLLAREAGLLARNQNGELTCPLPVVPLFETIEDLQDSHDILDRFLTHPFTRRSIEWHKGHRQEQNLIQQVMIGYSDSNKDGGILASQWNLASAQTRLADTGRKHGVKIRFFHGKGGSISRGAGPTQWFLKTLPHGTIDGDLRLTEQGETISQKYANRVNAAYNLELLLANTAAMTLIHRLKKEEKELSGSILKTLAEVSQKHYNSLIHHPDFITFYSQATPIDVIERSKIGSRPARRTGRRSLEDLRAIPWVFSWAQSRFNLTSWFGVGKALNYLKEQQPEDYEALKAEARRDTLMKYVLLNVDTSLAATDEKIMALYASLVEAEGLRKEIFDNILEELSLTRACMDEIFGLPFSERRPHHYFSNQLRAEALDDLHRAQVYWLREWRALNSEGEEADALLQKLLLSVNAIAGALRSTG